MPTQIAIGFSQAADAQEAAHHACVAAKGQLNTTQTDLVLLFATPAYAGEEALGVVQKILQPKRLLGSSAAGLILTEGVFSRGLAVLAINSDELSFAINAVSSSPGKEMRTPGFEMGRKLNADFKTHQRQACLLFTDPLFHNDTDFIRGAQEVLGLGFPLLGAVGCVDRKHRKDCQFYNKQVLTQSAVGLLIGGAVVGTGNQHGFKPLGKPRTITKATNNVIHTIDDKPAFALYDAFLGPEAQKLAKGISPTNALLYPLGIYLEEQGQYLLKNAVDILPDGSIVCQGEVPQGAEVHLMIGSRESCRKSAMTAANQVKDALGGKEAKLVIIIESAARQKLLKSSAGVEIRAVRDILGNNVPVIGMYGFGEIVPLGAGHGINNTCMQNESILILGLD